ncbi:MAG: serine/threonine protein phosphatase [Oscillospiraceae bacterium]|nr:serine/threonine protein phosphatase [Oscillospiraceae bacterium]MBQ9929735.1 serine/threonine protein phosphatase [Oscillospiraceae bacterium]
MKRKRKETPVAATACQLRDASSHPFGALRGFVPLGGGEERIYRELREAIPVLDAAVGKLVRLSGGFQVRCKNPHAQQKLENFLKNVPCGRGQVGIDSFLSGYVDSLLTVGRAVGEMVLAGAKLRAVYWGDVTQLQICEGDSPLDVVLYGPDSHGTLRALPYQHLLLFTTLNPEPGHPYGVSLFRGMPFLADILMKIYAAIGANWERAGNVRYSVICKNGENADPATVQDQGAQIAKEWARAMEDSKNGTVRDFVAVGDVQIKVIGGEAPILDSQVPVKQILEQLVAKTGLPPFLLGLSWSTTERMSTQQADILTSELWALRRSIEPVVRKICKTYLALEGLDDRVEIEWNDISLQDITEEAKAELYAAQAAKYRAEAKI